MRFESTKRVEVLTPMEINKALMDILEKLNQLAEDIEQIKEELNNAEEL